MLPMHKFLDFSTCNGFILNINIEGGGMNGSTESRYQGDLKRQYKQC